MRQIDTILIHCSATKEGQNFTVKDVDRWHRANGWNGCGYHYVVRLDGTVENGRDINLKGAHCPQESMNSKSIGICYIGGLDAKGNPKDTRTVAQKLALSALVRELKQKYPSIKQVLGHRDVKGVKKACPCFDAKKEYN